jgi:hypothetical protein
MPQKRSVWVAILIGGRTMFSYLYTGDTDRE